MTIHEVRLVDESLLEAGERRYACRIGRAGIAPLGEKREGDLRTPSGRFVMRRVYYRPDRVPAPTTALPVIALTPEDGWCDDPSHAAYNLPVKRPFAGRHEQLWREDHVYDYVIPLGYNDGVDSPIIPGAGSAIFMHLMRADGVGTEGCIALSRADLLELLAMLAPGAVVEV